MRNVRRTGRSLVNAFTQAVTNARPVTFKGTWSYLNVSYDREYLRRQRLFIVHPRPALNLKATKRFEISGSAQFSAFPINFPVFSSLNFKRKMKIGEKETTAMKVKEKKKKMCRNGGALDGAH